MIHQHFTLVPSLTVTENVLLGLREPRFRLHLPHYAQRIQELAARSGLRVDPMAKVWDLSVGEQQRVEIIKMLYRGCRVLIMDEPTAVLAPQEAEELFRTLRDMTARGESIVFISHKLDEVLAIADRITILRKGKVTADGISAAGRTRPELARLMVGRDVLEVIERTPSTPGPVVLELSSVDAVDERGLPALRDVNLQIRAGEIMGLAGVAGNGQSELAEVITGLRGCTGRVTVHGEELAGRPPLRAIDAGVAHIPEDRHGVGSAPDLSLADNLMMKSYRRAPIARGWLVDSTVARDRARGAQGGIPGRCAQYRHAGPPALRRQSPATHLRAGSVHDAQHHHRGAALTRTRCRGRGDGPSIAAGATHGGRCRPAHQRGPG